jgi:hypothetical protein
MTHPERTPAEWYEEAARHYVEGHQACAWCSAPYQVFRIETAAGVQYHCNWCDFQADHDAARGRYHVVPGARKTAKSRPLTMHG